MEKKLNQNQEAEALRIKEWCMTIINFISAKTENNKQHYEIYEEPFSDDTKRKYLQKASPSIYIKGLRQVFRDTNEWAQGLSQVYVDELNSILREKFGEDLNSQSDLINKKIEKILIRGKINNDDEFRMLNARVDEICQTNPNDPDLNKLNTLLLEYETKK